MNKNEVLKLMEAFEKEDFEEFEGRLAKEARNIIAQSKALIESQASKLTQMERALKKIWKCTNLTEATIIAVEALINLTQDGNNENDL